ncbi:hypothetical protein U0070_023198, partial [Myodes glareolus]
KSPCTLKGREGWEEGAVSAALLRSAAGPKPVCLLALGLTAATPFHFLASFNFGARGALVVRGCTCWGMQMLRASLLSRGSGVDACAGVRALGKCVSQEGRPTSRSRVLVQSGLAKAPSPPKAPTPGSASLLPALARKILGGGDQLRAGTMFLATLYFALPLLDLLLSAEVSGGDRLDCVKASDQCLKEQTCSTKYRTLRQCVAGKETNFSLASGLEAKDECRNAMEALKQKSLYNCRCKRGMKKEKNCLRIYWSMYQSLQGNDLLEDSPYEPVNSRLSDIFRAVPFISGKLIDRYFSAVPLPA